MYRLTLSPVYTQKRTLEVVVEQCKLTRESSTSGKEIMIGAAPGIRNQNVKYWIKASCQGRTVGTVRYAESVRIP